ncbi:chorismate mutase [Streptococcus dentapri]|uniref:Chorismate mutase n=1 Tax=Streptococcus dentapri TaxID=573564 RepID=A0ABV8CYP6_9STRE
MKNITEVRQATDQLDQELILPLAKRQYLVEQTGRLKNKNDIRTVQAADRVAQVLASRRQEATKVHLSPDVAEKI